MWTGNISSSWSETGNWDCNCLPTSDDDISVPPGSSLVLDTDATIKQLTLRGALHILEGQQLTIDGQNSGENVGLTLIVQNLIIDGSLLITGMVDKTSLQTSSNTEVIINGELTLDQSACSSADCPNFNVVYISGNLINNGDFIIQKPRATSVISVFGSIENNGLIEIDSANVSNHAFGLGQASSFNNSATAIFRMTNILAEGNFCRGLQSFVNDQSITNDGEFIIHSIGGNLRSIDLRGSNTTFLNRGTFEVAGGQVAIELRDINFFRNEGSIEISEQAGSGINVRGPANIQNEGSWQFINGNSTSALQLIGINGRPQFINRGDLVVENYLSDFSQSKAISQIDGVFDNFGSVELTGNGTGIAWDAGVDSLTNHTDAYIRCDNFSSAFKASASFENQGNIVFGPDLATAFINNNLSLRNLGIIEGFGNIQSSAIEWGSGSTLAPGEADTIGSIIMTNDFNLAVDNTILLDLNTEGSDQVQALGSIDFSGTIQVGLNPDFEPQPKTYTLLEASSGLTGTPNIELPVLPANWEWTIEQDQFSLQLILSMINSTTSFDQEAPLSVYPNPVMSGGDLFLSSAHSVPQQTAVLMHLDGRVIERFKLSTNQNRIELPLLPAGIYMLSIAGRVNRISIL